MLGVTAGVGVRRSAAPLQAGLQPRGRAVGRQASSGRPGCGVGERDVPVLSGGLGRGQKLKGVRLK